MLVISGKSYRFSDDSVISIEADPANDDISIEHEGDMTIVTVGGTWITIKYGTLNCKIV